MALALGPDHNLQAILPSLGVRGSDLHMSSKTTLMWVEFGTFSVLDCRILSGQDVGAYILARILIFGIETLKADNKKHQPRIEAMLA